MDSATIQTAFDTEATIRERLKTMAEPALQAFTAKLIPTIPSERILGVRTPALRAYARKLHGTAAAESFLNSLPHLYQEENLLHAYLLAYEKDFGHAMTLLTNFLPFVDNWAVCDGISLPCFKKHRQALLEAVHCWLEADHTYTIRFGIKMLMDHFLDADFDPSCLETVAAVTSEEYYVNMMIAWYFATALAKQWDAALPFLKDGRLDRWVHNKTIQKAVESYRITDTQKALLRSLRRPG
ncbi:MAG: DNA alkylation repair protein [Oscillospiraceae bacterium]|nr:DNA alkylation repair protein [Oscillospiraceae bacterium]